MRHNLWQRHWQTSLCGAADAWRCSVYTLVGYWFVSERVLCAMACLHTQPYYIAPETMMDGQLNKASDIYSLGVIMWEVFNAEPPWVSAGMCGKANDAVQHAVGSVRVAPYRACKNPWGLASPCNQHSHPMSVPAGRLTTSCRIMLCTQPVRIADQKI